VDDHTLRSSAAPDSADGGAIPLAKSARLTGNESHLIIGGSVEIFSARGQPSASREPLERGRCDRVDWRARTGRSQIDPAEVEVQLDGQAGGFADLEAELARQPQHRGVFVEDESGQRLEIVLRGASEREAQEPFTDALPYAVRADDEPDDGRTP
jgi:hypothetical protein